MFGKKVSNPLIKEIEDIFGDRVISVTHAESQNNVYLEPKQFVGVAKMCRGLIFKFCPLVGYNQIRFAVIGPDNFLYSTTIAIQVKE